MAESDLDRNHTATPYKLKKARERGQIAKSPEIVSALVLAAAMLFLAGQGWATWSEQLKFDRALMLRAGEVEGAAAIWSLIAQSVSSIMRLGAPFLTTLVIVAVIGNLIQTGPVLSVEPISPDLDRINPVSGFKRIISVRTLFSAFRAALKLTLLCVTTYFSLKGLLPQFNHLSGLGPAGLFQIMLGDFSSLGLKLAGVLFLISLLDLIYIKREFAKKMKMSTREVKDEAKSRDGDPRIRARLRQLRKEMLKRSLSLRNTGAADVLITNPTHIAVALRYSHGEMTSPQLVAKGRGSMAVAMRMIAARHRIPVVQSPSLARALYRDLDIDQHVQPGLYSQVARIIVWVFARRDAVRRAATNGTDRQNSSHESSPRNTGSLRWTS